MLSDKMDIFRSYRLEFGIWGLELLVPLQTKNYWNLIPVIWDLPFHMLDIVPGQELVRGTRYLLYSKTTP